ncbi:MULTISPECIES: MBL fold metallo-hydrolase [unclassified Rhizobium]|uniref:MBL fold metallo-hydrolase n=1 Tax=unclassified Rhizobium TaxID=2613769 RepID=UPI00161D3989|nr:MULTISPECIES: MBL fold metallo-hydrolase [unclassified Rhizobium]MBB3319996.1 L-ascorbate metabolism protein UlaG (beta-lactamase superfamily) [Rhizobium sp. BK181]MBB3545036.1 L-ascorbate metabolism protein UlaG (beta-lactamase superfamily) [Rhizobium sp. BK399]MCS3743746.1 L-ascorbate metabolism protein UlaG (beta-lactamase superfamily) [Rhizobium sp. BK661]MCS4095707.1 L-ascorbate metabolism protein UlaG (beta-lactamase superfamily) [Rhizobium sp. BK176]
MTGRLEETTFSAPLADYLSKPPAKGLRLYWLGQAGFVIDIDGRRLVIDPYLSDTLAEKYRGTERPHERMMPPPVSADEIAFVDLVLCTHAHTDHMDPGTLKPLLEKNPSAGLLAPRAMRQQAIDRSCVAESRIVLTNAGETVSPLPELTILPTASAHEAMEIDAAGDCRFLGYVIAADAVRLWHSGDCIPFPGLERDVLAHRPDITLLPVNGRRPELSQNGVAGNFSLHEAIGVTRRIGARDMVAHHYGLFAFNTEEPETIDAAIASTADLRIHRAQTGLSLSWRAE